jgi:hypothetical protein
MNPPLQGDSDYNVDLFFTGLLLALHIPLLYHPLCPPLVAVEADITGFESIQLHTTNG